MPELSRREWMRIVGAGGAALAAGCGEPGEGELAAAVLEPSQSALLVSIWARRGREATLEVRGGGGAATHVVPLAASGTGALDVRGLLPGAAYELTVRAGDAAAGPYRASTAPPDADGRPVRLAIVADVDPNPEFDTDLAGHVVDA